MRKSFLHCMAIPAGISVVYMCWLTGYTAGYEDGGMEAWDQARNAFMVEATPISARTLDSDGHLEVPTTGVQPASFVD